MQELEDVDDWEGCDEILTRDFPQTGLFRLVGLGEGVGVAFF